MRPLILLLTLLLASDIYAQKVIPFHDLEKEVRNQIWNYWMLDDEEDRYIVIGDMLNLEAKCIEYTECYKIDVDYSIFQYRAAFIMPSRNLFFIKHKDIIIFLEDSWYKDTFLTQVQTLVNYFLTYQDAPQENFPKYLKILMENREQNLMYLE